MERFFFFGTLMDRDVLSAVTLRPVDRDELKPARLGNYRAAAAIGATHPVLVACAGATLEGLLFTAGSETEVRRIRFFETTEFGCETLEVETAEGSKSAATVFSTSTFDADPRLDWSPHRWQQQDKPLFLALTRMWMEYFDDGDLEQADRRWDRMVEHYVATGEIRDFS